MKCVHISWSIVGQPVVVGKLVNRCPYCFLLTGQLFILPLHSWNPVPRQTAPAGNDCDTDIFDMPKRPPILKNSATRHIQSHRYSTDGRDTGFSQTRHLVGMSENIFNTVVSSWRCVAAYTVLYLRGIGLWGICPSIPCTKAKFWKLALRVQGMDGRMPPRPFGFLSMTILALWCFLGHAIIYFLHQ